MGEAVGRPGRLTQSARLLPDGACRLPPTFTQSIPPNQPIESDLALDLAYVGLPCDPLSEYAENRRSAALSRGDRK